MQETNIKTLYVIGNGFDLYHGLKSSYRNYRDWLLENHKEIYKEMVKLYGEEVSDKLWWGSFEENLGYVPDVRERIEEIADSFEPDEEKDSFNPEEGGRCVDNKLSSLVNSLKSTFAEWVNSLGTPQGNKIKFDTKNCLYLSFNYTHTLEDYYKISPKIVKHIHGDIKRQKFILGHGRSKEEIYDDTAAPIAPWDGTSSPSDHGLDGVDNENYANVRKAYAKNILSIRKNTKQIIHDNKHFFSKLANVQKVVFVGFSFSCVDILYFKKIIDSVLNNVSVSATYYSEGDKDKINEVSRKFSCKIQPIQIGDLTE